MLVGGDPPTVTWLEAIKNAPTIAKVYLTGVLIHGIILVLLSIVSIDDPHVANVYAFLGVFCACCFLYFSFQGVLKDNVMQLRCAILSAFLISVYLIWYCLFKDHEIIIYVIGTSSGVLTLGYIIMYKWIVDGFGWYRYNRLKIADPRLEEMYYTFQVFKAMVFLDVEMVTVMWILIFIKIVDTPPMMVINIVCIALQFAWSFLGLRAVRAEHWVSTRVFLFCSIGVFGYVGYNFYEIISVSDYTHGTSENQYIVAMLMAVVVRCTLLYWLFKVSNNFDNGLKTHVFDTGMEDMDYWGEGTQISRVSTGPEFIPNSNYHLMDEKHVIVKSDNEDDDDNVNNNNKNKNNIANNVNDKNNQNNDKNDNRYDSIDSRVSNNSNVSQSKDISFGGVAKFSTGSAQRGKKKKSSNIPSIQPTNFNRTRLDSSEFD